MEEAILAHWDARRQEEKEYREHPDAADKGFIRGLEFLRERGVIGDFKAGEKPSPPQEIQKGSTFPSDDSSLSFALQEIAKLKDNVNAIQQGSPMRDLYTPQFEHKSTDFPHVEQRRPHHSPGSNYINENAKLQGAYDLIAKIKAERERKKSAVPRSPFTSNSKMSPLLSSHDRRLSNGSNRSGSFMDDTPRDHSHPLSMLSPPLAEVKRHSQVRDDAESFAKQLQKSLDIATDYALESKKMRMRADVEQYAQHLHELKQQEIFDAQAEMQQLKKQLGSVEDKVRMLSASHEMSKIDPKQAQEQIANVASSNVPPSNLTELNTMQLKQQLAEAVQEMKNLQAKLQSSEDEILRVKAEQQLAHDALRNRGNDTVDELKEKLELLRQQQEVERNLAKEEEALKLAAFQKEKEEALTAAQAAAEKEMAAKIDQLTKDMAQREAFLQEQIEENHHKELQEMTILTRNAVANAAAAEQKRLSDELEEAYAALETYKKNLLSLQAEAEQLRKLQQFSAESFTEGERHRIEEETAAVVAVELAKVRAEHEAAIKQTRLEAALEIERLKGGKHGSVDRLIEKPSEVSSQANVTLPDVKVDDSQMTNRLLSIESAALEKLRVERLAVEDAARVERERLAKVRADAELEKIRSERLAAEEEAQLELENLKRQREARAAAIEKARVEAEQEELEIARKIEAQHLAAKEAARAEAEMLLREEAKKLEAERLATEEALRKEAARLEAQKLEAERLAAEETTRIEAQKLEAERLAAEETARLEAQKLDAERLVAEETARLEAERLEREMAEKMEAERLAAAEAVRLEAERLEREMAEKLEAERLAAEEALRKEAARLEAEKLEAERLAAVEAARLEAERSEREKAEKLDAERLVAEETARLEAERLEREAAEKLEAERLVAEESARLEAERLEREMAEKLEAERVAAEVALLEAERLERENKEKLEAERLATEEFQMKEAMRLEAEKVNAERVSAEEAALLETERLEREEAEKLEAERAAEMTRLEAACLEKENAKKVEAGLLAAEEAVLLESQRLKRERAEELESVKNLATEEAGRLEAEREAVARVERVQAERLAAEEAARLEVEGHTTQDVPRRTAWSQETVRFDSPGENVIVPQDDNNLSNEAMRLQGELISACDALDSARMMLFDTQEIAVNLKSEKRSVIQLFRKEVQTENDLKKIISVMSENNEALLRRNSLTSHASSWSENDLDFSRSNGFDNRRRSSINDECKYVSVDTIKDKLYNRPPVSPRNSLTSQSSDAAVEIKELTEAQRVNVLSRAVEKAGLLRKQSPSFRQSAKHSLATLSKIRDEIRAVKEETIDVECELQVLMQEVDIRRQEIEDARKSLRNVQDEVSSLHQRISYEEEISKKNENDARLKAEVEAQIAAQREAEGDSIMFLAMKSMEDKEEKKRNDREVQRMAAIVDLKKTSSNGDISLNENTQDDGPDQENQSKLIAMNVNTEIDVDESFDDFSESVENSVGDVASADTLDVNISDVMNQADSSQDLDNTPSRRRSTSVEHNMLMKEKLDALLDKDLNVLESGSFFDYYELGDVLGSGAYSTVRRATNKNSGETVAVKCIDYKSMNADDEEQLHQEVAVLKLIDHPHVLKFHGFYKEKGTGKKGLPLLTPKSPLAHYKHKKMYFLVTECLEGGELFDRIVHKTFYSEKDARNVIFILMETVAYLHHHRIVHRDLKPENLLIYADDDTSIKIADFGFAERTDGFISLKTKCGTPGYVAPEVLLGQPYGKAVDMWAIGVIMYVLLGGYPPFNHEDPNTTIVSDVEFHPEYWDQVSSDAKDLIRKLLRKDPLQRWSADEALKHPWMTLDAEKLSMNLGTNLEMFRRSHGSRRFKSAVKAIIAARRMSKALATLGIAKNLNFENEKATNETISYSNGAVYKGDLLGGLKHGEGIYESEEENIYYSGSWENDKRHGKGRSITKEGIYDGEWQSDHTFGAGTMHYNDGGVYVGQVMENYVRHGKGRYTSPEGYVYEGDWEKDNQCGTDCVFSMGGDIYKGGFRDNKFDGEGVLTFSNGDVYEGTFSCGKFSDFGSFSGVNGVEYQGEYLNGLKHGLGREIITVKSGDSYSVSEYTGEWEKGIKKGQGKIEYQNGNVYEGEFQDDKPSGPGILTFAGGTVKEIRIASDMTTQKSDLKSLDNSDAGLAAFDKMMNEEKKKSHIDMLKEELLSTEKTYVSNMIVAIEVIIDPLKVSSLMKQSDMNDQFSDYRVIASIHKHIYNDLTSVPSDELRVGQVMLKYTPSLKLYKGYLQNYEQRLRERRMLLAKKSSPLNSFISNAQSDERCRGNTLESFLIEPVQRIPRYQLLLQEMKKRMSPDNDEYSEICRALDEVCAVASYNNDAIRAKDVQSNQMNEMIEIVQKTKIDVLDKPRTLLKQGALPCYRFGKQETLNFYLFSDQILIGKLGGRRDAPVFSRIDLQMIHVHGNYQLPAKRDSSIIRRKIGFSSGSKSDSFGDTDADADNEKVFCNIIVFQSPRESFLILTRSIEEKDEWLGAILRATENDQTPSHNTLLHRTKSKRFFDEETTRTSKVYVFAPVWEMKDHFSRCNLCSSKFGLFKLKHHCRSCGGVFCDSCTSHRAEVAYLNPNNVDVVAQHRICSECAAVREDCYQSESVDGVNSQIEGKYSSLEVKLLSVRNNDVYDNQQLKVLLMFGDVIKFSSSASRSRDNDNDNIFWDETFHYWISDSGEESTELFVELLDGDDTEDGVIASRNQRTLKNSRYGYASIHLDSLASTKKLQSGAPISLDMPLLGGSHNGGSIKINIRISYADRDTQSDCDLYRDRLSLESSDLGERMTSEVLESERDGRILKLNSDNYSTQFAEENTEVTQQANVQVNGMEVSLLTEKSDSFKALAETAHSLEDNLSKQREVDNMIRKLQYAVISEEEQDVQTKKESDACVELSHALTGKTSPGAEDFMKSSELLTSLQETAAATPAAKQMNSDARKNSDSDSTADSEEPSIKLNALVEDSSEESSSEESSSEESSSEESSDEESSASSDVVSSEESSVEESSEDSTLSVHVIDATRQGQNVNGNRVEVTEEDYDTAVVDTSTNLDPYRPSETANLNNKSIVAPIRVRDTPSTYAPPKIFIEKTKSYKKVPSRLMEPTRASQGSRWDKPIAHAENAHHRDERAGKKSAFRQTSEAYEKNADKRTLAAGKSQSYKVNDSFEPSEYNNVSKFQKVQSRLMEPTKAFLESRRVVKANAAAKNSPKISPQRHTPLRPVRQAKKEPDLIDVEHDISSVREESATSSVSALTDSDTHVTNSEPPGTMKGKSNQRYAPPTISKRGVKSYNHIQSRLFQPTTAYMNSRRGKATEKGLLSSNQSAMQSAEQNISEHISEQQVEHDDEAAVQDDDGYDDEGKTESDDSSGYEVASKEKDQTRGDDSEYEPSDEDDVGAVSKMQHPPHTSSKITPSVVPGSSTEVSVSTAAATANTTMTPASSNNEVESSVESESSTEDEDSSGGEIDGINLASISSMTLSHVQEDIDVHHNHDEVLNRLQSLGSVLSVDTFNHSQGDRKAPTFSDERQRQFSTLTMNDFDSDSDEHETIAIPLNVDDSDSGSDEASSSSDEDDDDERITGNITTSSRLLRTQPLPEDDSSDDDNFSWDGKKSFVSEVDRVIGVVKEEKTGRLRIPSRGLSSDSLGEGSTTSFLSDLSLVEQARKEATDLNAMALAEFSSASESDESEEKLELEDDDTEESDSSDEFLHRRRA